MQNVYTFSESSFNCIRHHFNYIFAKQSDSNAHRGFPLKIQMCHTYSQHYFHNVTSFSLSISLKNYQPFSILYISLPSLDMLALRGDITSFSFVICTFDFTFFQCSKDSPMFVHDFIFIEYNVLTEAVLFVSRD